MLCEANLPIIYITSAISGLPWWPGGQEVMQELFLPIYEVSSEIYIIFSIFLN